MGKDSLEEIMAKTLDLSVSPHLKNSTADAIEIATVEERIVDHVPPMVNTKPKGEKEKHILGATAKNDQERQISLVLPDTSMTSTRNRIESCLCTITTLGSNTSRNRRNSLVSTTTRRNSLVSTTTAGSLIEELLLDFDVDVSVPRYKKRSFHRRCALSTIHHPPFELDLHDSCSTFSSYSQELANNNEGIQTLTPENEPVPLKDDKSQSFKDDTLQSEEKSVQMPSFLSITRQTQYSNCRAKNDLWLDEKVSKQRKYLTSNIRKVSSLMNLYQSKTKAGSSSMPNMQVFLQSSPFFKSDQCKQQKERRGSKLMGKRFRSFSFQNEEEEDGNILLKNLKEMEESNLLNVIRLGDDDIC